MNKSIRSLLAVAVLIFSITTSIVSATPNTSRIIDGTRVPGSTYPNVVQLLLGGSLCTGTLIAPSFVLTAAHCFYDDSNQQAVGDTGVEVNFADRSIQSSKVYIHPSYRSRSEACVEGEVDAAIVQLSSEATGITPASLGRSVPTVGLSMTLVGYGYEGTGAGGEGDGPPPDGIVNYGSTTIELITDTYIDWTFTSGESNTAGGDSGGPSFADVGGETELIGITCGGTGNAGFDTESYNTRVDQMVGWIDAIAGTSGVPTAPSLLGPTTIQGRVGTALSSTLSFTGSAPDSVTVDSLPAGLTLSGTTISGTPTTAGTSVSTITATNSIGSTTATVTFNITGFSPTLKVSRVALEFNNNGDDEDYLQIKGNITVPRNFKPKGKKLTIQIGRYSKSCKLDSTAGCGNYDYFELKGTLRNGAVTKTKVGFELQVVNLNLFTELASLGFPTADQATDGTVIMLPVEFLLNKVRYSTTVAIRFQSRNGRWTLSSAALNRASRITWRK